MSVAPAGRRWLLAPEAFAAVTAGMPPGAVPEAFRVEPSGGGVLGDQDPPAAASGPRRAVGAAPVEAGVRAAVAVQAAPDAAVSLRARYGTVEVLAEVAVRGAVVSTLLRARKRLNMTRSSSPRSSNKSSAGDCSGFGVALAVRPRLGAT